MDIAVFPPFINISIAFHWVCYLWVVHLNIHIRRIFLCMLYIDCKLIISSRTSKQTNISIYAISSTCTTISLPWLDYIVGFIAITEPFTIIIGYFEIICFTYRKRKGNQTSILTCPNNLVRCPFTISCISTIQCKYTDEISFALIRTIVSCTYYTTI